MSRTNPHNPNKEMHRAKNSVYAERDNTIGKIRNASDATIAYTANRSAMAGSMGGSVSPGRLQAETLAKMYEGRDRSIANAEMQYGQLAIQAGEQAYQNEAQRAAEFDANEPGIFDIVTSAISVVPGVGSLVGALKTGTNLLGMLTGLNGGTANNRVTTGNTSYSTDGSFVASDRVMSPNMVGNMTGTFTEGYSPMKTKKTLTLFGPKKGLFD